MHCSTTYPPNLDQRTEILLHLLREAASSSTVYMVIDGCDECTDFKGVRNTLFSQDLVSLQISGGNTTSKNQRTTLGIRLFLTTRDKQLLPRVVVDACGETTIKLLNHDKVVSDIETYARMRITQMGERAVAGMTKVADEEYGNLLEKVVYKITQCSGGL